MVSKVPLDGQSLADLFPLLIEEWDFKKNQTLKPHDFKPSSASKVFWICAKKHSWKTSISHRSFNKSSCPYCAGKKVWAGFNDFKSVFPDLYKELHPTKNEKLEASSLAQYSKTNVWWLGKCGHEWNAAVSSRTFAKSGCPYCKGRKVLFGFNDLLTLQPKIASEWHPIKNMGRLSSEFTPGSGFHAWWVGKCGHEWRAKICDRVTYETQCPKCSSTVSQAEREILKFIKTETIIKSLSILTNSRQILKNKELDIFIPSINLAIEFNGIYWHSVENGKGKSYHFSKWEECLKQGITLLYIWEDDWVKDKKAILDRLKDVIENKEDISFIHNIPNLVENGSFTEVILRRKGFSYKELYKPQAMSVIKHTRVPLDVNLKAPTIYNAGYSLY